MWTGCEHVEHKVVFKTASCEWIWAFNAKWVHRPNKWKYREPSERDIVHEIDDNMDWHDECDGKVGIFFLYYPYIMKRNDVLWKMYYFSAQLTIITQMYCLCMSHSYFSSFHT